MCGVVKAGNSICKCVQGTFKVLSSDTKVESGREPEQRTQFCHDRVVSGPLVDDVNSSLIITMNDNMFI